MRPSARRASRCGYMSRSARCVWLLGLALAQAADDGAFVGACTSDKEGDLGHEACYGWCSASQAADHCPWCKCKGCVWCASNGGASDALSAGPTQECQSSIADDVSYEDCQDFCSVSAKETHCQSCKCRACGFCDDTCTSAFEDDGHEETCEPWCSTDYFGEHCQRCKCKGCAFCKDGPPCSSDVPDDSSFAMCEPFCDAGFASSHCGMCKCRSCDFCAATSVEGTSSAGQLAMATCNSGVEGDVSVESCEAFCDAGSKDEHCSLCKCRGCDFCSCSSEHPEDSSVEECQKWCNDDQIASHCSWCTCKACRFCRVGGKACQSFYVSGDTDYETCDAFCNPSSADTHCSFCKCKGCGFCTSGEHTSRGVAAPPPPACFSGQSHDFLYESCERFCADAEDQQGACKLCKCKGCSACSSQCNSGVPGDTTTVGCSSSCDKEHAEGFCPMCRCRGCPFCHADGTVSDVSNAPGDATTCVKANDRDIDHPACYSHCSESNKATHCETCKCKECGFCHGFQACDSGKKGDTKWKDCDASACDGGESCSLCRCKGCDSCEAWELSNTQLCDSGIIGDTEYETCLGGICSSKQSDAHCQMCRCKTCGFCAGFGEGDDAEEEEEKAAASRCTSAYADDVSFPTCDSFCSPEYAKDHCARCKCKECSFCREMAAACDAGHVADGKTEQCAPWCATTQGLPVETMCSFCSCRRCGMCDGVDFVDTPTGNGQSCAVGAEVLVLSAKKDDDKNMHYDVRIRLGSWQPEGKVKVSLEGGPKVHYESGSESHAALLAQEGASRVFTFGLGAQPGPLNTFGFRFSLGRASFDVTSKWPTLVCWNIGAAPPARPQPPPPPFTPFVASTLHAAETPQSQQPHFTHAPDFCRLGGKLNIEKQWAGGTSFQASLVVALWRAGAVITLDFWTPLGEGGRGDVRQIGAQHATNAEVLGGGGQPGTMRFRLKGEPNELNGFNFIGHGGIIHAHPIITCSGLPASEALPPPPPRARVDESCAPLGLMYSVIQTWNGGFKAACAVTHWVAGAGVKVTFAGGGVQLLDSWSAQAAVRSGSSLEMVLGGGPDPDSHGFGFTARGDKAAAATPEISCAVDAVASLVQVPSGLCGMGAAYEVVAPVTEGAASEMKLRLSQWEIGAVVAVEFAARVEASQPAAAATRQSNALGTLHTFELGDFPNADHGFSFEAAGDLASLRIVRVSCVPRQTTSPPAPALAKGTPGAAQGLALRGATCDTLELAWQPAVDNGFAVRGYAVSYRRRDAAEDGFEELELGPGTTATLKGLSGSTTYYIKVRARNERGAGRLSDRLAAATSSGGGAPQSATAPPGAVESPDCHSITLALPPLRAGCRGDAYLSVQRREVGDAASDWATVVERSAQSAATVGGLEPLAVSEFRLVAHNDDGQSPPSASGGLVLTDAFRRVGLPPTVVPTSSASFAIAWAELAGACRPALRFQLLYTRSPGMPGEEGWVQLATEVPGSSYEAFPLRCAAPGCAFRVRPLGLPGAEQLAPHSAPRTTLPLPGLLEGSTRLELRLRSSQLDRDQVLMRRQVEDEVERALQVPRGTVDVRDVFGFGRYLVLDPNPSPSPSPNPNPNPKQVPRARPAHGDRAARRQRAGGRRPARRAAAATRAGRRRHEPAARRRGLLRPRRPGGRADAAGRRPRHARARGQCGGQGGQAAAARQGGGKPSGSGRQDHALPHGGDAPRRVRRVGRAAAGEPRPLRQGRARRGRAGGERA